MTINEWVTPPIPKSIDLQVVHEYCLSHVALGLRTFWKTLSLWPSGALNVELQYPPGSPGSSFPL